MWRASTRSWVLGIQKYRNRVSSSFFHLFHQRPVSSPSESAISACILMSFGPDIARWTACVGNVCVGDAAVEAVEFCEAGTASVPSRMLDILVAKYNVHGRKQTRIIQQKQLSSRITRRVTADLVWTLQFEIDEPIREELDVFDPSDLESWDEMGDYWRRGSSQYFSEIRTLSLYMATSHTNTHPVRGRPQQKRK